MVKDFLKIIKLYRYPIFSGFLIGTSYLPFPPWALFFCLTPLLIFTYQNIENLKRVFIGGFVSQFILSVIGFYWIAIVSQEYGYLPWPAAIACLFVFAAFVHLYFPISLFLVALAHKKNPLKAIPVLILFAFVLCFFESVYPRLFSWNFGYPLVAIESLGIRQWVDVVGVLGLSLGVLLTNAIFAYLFMTRPKHSGKVVFAIFAFWIGAHFAGTQRSDFWSESKTSIKALVVQANIGNLDKLIAEKGRGFQREIAQQYFQLTRQGVLQNPDAQFVIWPESAIPEYLNSEGSERRQRAQEVFNFIKETNKHFIIGAYSKDGPDTQKPKDYNSLFYFNSEGIAVAPPYKKSHLLVFGEYTPFADVIPALAEISPAGEGFGRGSGPSVTELKSVKWGSQICYESLDPNFSADLAKLGADIMINVTNDSWFSSAKSRLKFLQTSSEAYQHLEMTLARTLENRRPLIRSTNTGITTAILADGKVLSRGPTQSTWFKMFEVPYKENAPLTFHTRFGAYFPHFLAICILLALVFGRQSMQSKQDE